jgi:hypothetical protein
VVATISPEATASILGRGSMKAPLILADSTPISQLSATLLRPNCHAPLLAETVAEFIDRRLTH